METPQLPLDKKNRILQRLKGKLDGHENTKPATRKKSKARRSVDSSRQGSPNLSISDDETSSVGTPSSVVGGKLTSYNVATVKPPLNDPRIFMTLKAVLLNSNSNPNSCSTPDDVLAAGREIAQPASQLGRRAKKLQDQLKQCTGSTWSDYSARRLSLRAEEDDAIKMAFPPLDEERWAEAIMKQQKIEAKVRKQRLELEALIETQRKYGTLDKKSMDMYKDMSLKFDEHNVEHELDAVCSGCCRIFKGMRRLRLHQAKCPAPFLRYFCQVDGCFAIFEDEERYRKHYNSKHQREPPVPEGAGDGRVHLKTIEKIKETYAQKIEREKQRKIEEELRRVKAEQEAAEAAEAARLLAEEEQCKKRREIEAAKAAIVWSDEKLDKLSNGDLVWFKYRDYPFWPGQVSSYSRDNGNVNLYVQFFGDDTCEKAKNIEKNLRLFRCSQFDQFVNAGHRHSLGTVFRKALHEAILAESEAVTMGAPIIVNQDEKTFYGGMGGVLQRRLARSQFRKRRLPEQTQDGKNAVMLLGNLTYRVGQIVWCKLSGYPFWPARLMSVDRTRTKALFFGDNTTSLVRKLGENMRPFRCSEKELFIKQGREHKFGGEAFESALKEANDDHDEVPRSMSLAEKNATQARKKVKEAESLLQNSNSEVSRLQFLAPGKKSCGLEPTRLSVREQKKLARALGTQNGLDLMVQKPSGNDGYQASYIPSQAAKGLRPKFAWSTICGALPNTAHLLAEPPRSKPKTTTNRKKGKRKLSARAEISRTNKRAKVGKLEKTEKRARKKNSRRKRRVTRKPKRRKEMQDAPHPKLLFLHKM